MTKASTEGFEYRIYDRLKRKYILRIYNKYEKADKALQNLIYKEQDLHRFDIDLRMIGGMLPWKH